MNDPTVQCQVCSRVFTTQTINDHVFEFHDVKTKLYRCPYCAHVEPSAVWIHNHVSNIHNALYPIAVIRHYHEIVVQPYVLLVYCQQCSFKCQTQQELLVHHQNDCGVLDQPD